MSKQDMNWAAIDADPRFQALHAKKTRFLWGLMLVSVVYYFLLPIGAAYYQDLFKIKVWGPVNVGIIFAMSDDPGSAGADMPPPAGMPAP